MDATEARQRLERMVAWDTQPLPLASGAIDDLVEIAKTTDLNGGHPAFVDGTVNAAWVPTWDLRRAAAEGWRWKAAIAAGLHDYSADGTHYGASKLIQHCELMIKLFSRRPGTIYAGLRRPGFPAIGDVTIVGNG